MASIEAAMLTITLSPSSVPKRRNARLTVTCKVVFEEIERCIMQVCPNGTWFALEARCFGEDHPNNHSRDDELFFIQKRIFPLQDPSNITFIADVFEDALNEDPGADPPETPSFPPPPPGLDEIYVRLTLFNMFSNTVVAEVDTNVVTGVFR